MSLQTYARFLLAVMMIYVGTLHFRNPIPFIHIVPNFLPAHRLLVYISGIFEILGGLGLLIPPLRRAAAWGLIALFIAVFPANINMALHDIPINNIHYSPVLLWLRLPVQLLLIAWAWLSTKK